MKKYTLTLTKDERVIGVLKSKGRWPFIVGGVNWTESPTLETDDLSPFYLDPLPNQAMEKDIKELVDSRLIITENAKSKTKETDGELPKA